MPTYDLVCAACGGVAEVFVQRLLRDDDRVCPDCGAPDTAVRITGFVTARAPRSSSEPRVTGFAGTGCWRGLRSLSSRARRRREGAGGHGAVARARPLPRRPPEVSRARTARLG